MARSISTATLKSELEQLSPPGEQYYGLLRSARQSTSPVEEFMHLYHILLMFCGERQDDVDDFILSEDPDVPREPKPERNRAMRKRPAAKEETVYTRLRNEFGHPRSGADLVTTKTEMASRVGGLASLTKRAIEKLAAEQSAPAAE